MQPHADKPISVFFLAIFSVLAAAWTAPSALAAAAPPLSEGDRKLYSEALTAFESGHYDRALAMARQGTHPLADKIVTWLDLGRPESGRDFSELSAFLKAQADWPGLFAIYRNAEVVLPQSLSSKEVLAWFGDRPPISGTGARRHAIALWDSGQQARATAAARQYWTTGDFDAGEEVAFLARFKPFLTKQDEIERLDRLIWNQRTTAARRQVRRVPNDQAALANARLALIGNKPGVDALVNRVPAHLSNHPGLLYDRATWRQRRGRFEGVVEILDALPKEMPQEAAWWRLRNWVVWRALDRNDYALAYRVASRHGQVEGLAFAEGEWLAGWLALNYLNKPDVALPHFSRLHDGVSSDISKSRGAYWVGEAASRLGRLDEARKWYEAAAVFDATFYGQLAAQRIGLERSPTAMELPQVPAARQAAFDSSDVVQAARLLGELDQPRLQELFFARLRQKAKDSIDYHLVIELANAQGRQDLAMRTAKSARRDEVNLHHHLYPKRKLPTGPAPEPALVLSVMRQESEFYPKARSPVGALGLMQIMPATAQHSARRLGVPYHRDRLTEDPDYNMRLGQAYLDELLEQFSGSYILALAAYNAGPSRADSWIKLYGDPRNPAVDEINWIERIPFSETRNYVQRILESLTIYRQGIPRQEARWALRVPPAR